MGKKWNKYEYQLLSLLEKEGHTPEQMEHFFARNAEVDKNIRPRTAQAIGDALRNKHNGFITLESNQPWTREQQLFVLGLKKRGADYEHIGIEFQKVFHFTRTHGSMSGMVSRLRNDPDYLKEVDEQPTVLDAWLNIQKDVCREMGINPKTGKKPRNGMVPTMVTKEDMHENTMAILSLKASIDRLHDAINPPTLNKSREKFKMHPLFEDIIKEAGLAPVEEPVEESQGAKNGKTN